MLQLTELNRIEALRYLGGAGKEPNEAMLQLLDWCEPKVLAAAAPKYLYREVDLSDELLLQGESIKKHLEGCEKALVVCATLGTEIDRLIRISSITDMAESVVLDAFSSVAIEEVGRKLDDLLAEAYPDYYLTFRFSPGYGDYPISLQPHVLKLLDASRKIGLSCTDSCMLTPTKSITAVVGLSRDPLRKGLRGCATCNLKNTCQIRKRGDHCGY